MKEKLQSQLAIVCILYNMILILAHDYWAGKKPPPFIIFSWNFKLHTIAEFTKKKEQQTRDCPGSDRHTDLNTLNRKEAGFFFPEPSAGAGRLACSQVP